MEKNLKIELFRKKWPTNYARNIATNETTNKV